MSQPSTCYATLAKYNSAEPGTVQASVSVVPNPSQHILRAPVFGGMGYDTFAHQQVGYTCGGYFNIEAAYPDYSTNCGTMMYRSCGGTQLRK